MSSSKVTLPYGNLVPRHWSIARLKYLARLTNGFVFNSADRVESGVPIIRIENLNGSQEFNYTDVSMPGRYRVEQGDLLFAWSGNPGTSFGPYLWTESDSYYLNQHIFKLDVTGCDPRWLFWSLRAATPWIETDLVSGMIGMVHVTKEDLAGVPIPLPPLEEQRRIADFLDVETGKIDNLVTKKRHLVALLDERIDSRVLQHVGKSRLVNLDNGTTTLPIRRALTKVVRPAVSDVGVITAYRDGQVTDRNSRRAEGYTLSASSEPQGQFVQVGDVIVHGLDGFAGAIGTSEADGNCSPVYHVCSPNDGNDALCLGRLLRLLALQGYLGNFATSTRERAVDFRNWDLFGRIPIPVVPYEEQRQIGEWILKLRPLRAAIARSEKRAAERRQALITAAVTGEFDVSAASGRGIEE